MPTQWGDVATDTFFLIYICGVKVKHLLPVSCSVGPRCASPGGGRLIKRGQNEVLVHLFVNVTRVAGLQTWLAGKRMRGRPWGEQGR